MVLLRLANYFWGILSVPFCRHFCVCWVWARRMTDETTTTTTNPTTHDASIEFSRHFPSVNALWPIHSKHSSPPRDATKHDWRFRLQLNLRVFYKLKVKKYIPSWFWVYVIWRKCGWIAVRRPVQLVLATTMRMRPTDDDLNRIETRPSDFSCLSKDDAGWFCFCVLPSYSSLSLCI